MIDEVGVCLVVFRVVVLIFIKGVERWVVLGEGRVVGGGGSFGGFFY